MTTKGKKKNKAMSLSEFHSLPTTGTISTNEASNAQQSNIVRINWADEMEKYDDNAAPTDFVFDRSKLPTATKATRGPDIDPELIPKKPPFTAYLSNVSFEATEDKLRHFFKDLKIVNIRLPNDHGRAKGFAYVDFDDRESLIKALEKNETIFNNRSLKITLGEQKNVSNNNGYNRSSNEHNQPSGERGSEEDNWRRNQPELEEESAKPSFQSSGGSYHKYNRGGGNSGYQPRQFNRQNDGNRTYDENKQRRHKDYQGNQNKPYNEYHANRERRQYGFTDHSQKDSERSQNQTETSQPNDTPNSPPPQATSNEVTERRKVTINPRTLPVTESIPNPANQSSIFGGAKPVDTAAREREIEERLKEKERASTVTDKERQNSENQPELDENDNDNNESNDNNSNRKFQRSHRTSTASDEANHSHANVSHHHHHNQYPNRSTHHEHDGGKPRNYHKKNDNNNNSINNSSNSGRHQNRIQPSSSFTSPSSSSFNSSNQPNKQYQENKLKQNIVEAPRPTENAWKSRPAAVELFNNREQLQSESADLSRSSSYTINSNPSGRPNRPENSNNEDASNRRSYNKRPDSSNQPNKTFNRDRDYKGDKGRGGGILDRNKSGRNNQRGDRMHQDNNNNTRTNRNFNDRQFHSSNTQATSSSNQFDNYNNSYSNNSSEHTDLGFNNKFSKLKVDVDDADSENEY